jgi:hypothetical protein
VKSIARFMRRCSTPGVDSLRGLSAAGCWLAEARQALERRATTDASFALQQAARSLSAVACDLSRESGKLATAAQDLASAAVSLAEAAQSFFTGSPLRSLNDR